MQPTELCYFWNRHAGHRYDRVEREGGGGEGRVVVVGVYLVLEGTVFPSSGKKRNVTAREITALFLECAVSCCLTNNPNKCHEMIYQMPLLKADDFSIAR